MLKCCLNSDTVLLPSSACCSPSRGVGGPCVESQVVISSSESLSHSSGRGAAVCPEAMRTLRLPSALRLAGAASAKQGEDFVSLASLLNPCPVRCSDLLPGA